MSRGQFSTEYSRSFSISLDSSLSLRRTFGAHKFWCDNQKSDQLLHGKNPFYCIVCSSTIISTHFLFEKLKGLRLMQRHSRQSNFLELVHVECVCVCMAYKMQIEPHFPGKSVVQRNIFRHTKCPLGNKISYLRMQICVLFKDREKKKRLGRTNRQNILPFPMNAILRCSTIASKPDALTTLFLYSVRSVGRIVLCLHEQSV